MSLPERKSQSLENPVMEQKSRSDVFPSKKADEMIAMLKKGVEYTQDLLKENEWLRQTALKLQEQNRLLQARAKDLGPASEIGEFKDKLKSAQQEKESLEERTRELEKENREFAERFVEVDEQNQMLTNLYTASFQLHSSLDYNEVLRGVMEIIINLIGAERFAVMLLDEKSLVLKAVSVEGMELEEVLPVKVGDGVVGGAVASGEVFYGGEGKGAEEAPLVCLPLKIGDKVIGVIVIHALLKQKKKFTDVDYELFSMLGDHTATALFSAKLYTDAERRLSTIQGFIDLITK
jgi:nitrate/nitrite-specific signal transduction histidine kinase